MPQCLSKEDQFSLRCQLVQFTVSFRAGASWGKGLREENRLAHGNLGDRTGRVAERKGLGPEAVPRVTPFGHTEVCFSSALSQEASKANQAASSPNSDTTFTHPNFLENSDIDFLPGCLLLKFAERADLVHKEMNSYENYVIPPIAEFTQLPCRMQSPGATVPDLGLPLYPLRGAWPGPGRRRHPGASSL